ncbi:MAG: TolC family protein [Bacteroidales bacterium]
MQNRTNKKGLLSAFMLLLLATLLATAQDTKNTPLSLSLQEAMDYAAENNTNVKNARIDVAIADKKVWETTTIGLPQANLSGSYNNNLSLATQLLPAIIFGGEEGEFVEVQFGTQHNFSGAVTLNQLVFDGTYFVGLQAAKVYKQLSGNQLKKTRLETRATVATTYHAIALAKSNLETLEQNVETLESTLSQAKQLYNKGFIEKTEVTKLEVTRNGLTNSISSIKRQADYLLYLLKIQLGINPEQPVTLTEDLAALSDKIETANLLSTRLETTATVDYAMVSTQKEIALLELKKEKAALLPTLSVFYNYQYNAMRNEFTPFSADEKWFKSSMLGVQLAVPLFASGQRWSRIQQGELKLQKAQNNLAFLEQTLPAQWLQLRSNYLTALEKVENSLSNKALAQEVLDHTLTKHQKGVASSMELNQANQAFLDAHTQYTQALAEALNAKIALEKLTNTL